MDLSVISLLTAVGGVPSGAGLQAQTGASADTGGDALFGQFLQIPEGEVGGGSGAALLAVPVSDTLSELVPGLALAQPTTPAPDPLQLPAPKDLKGFSDLLISPQQAGAMANRLQAYLQRPDTAVVITDDLRDALSAMQKQLRLMAQAESPQPLAPVVAALEQAVPVHRSPERVGMMAQLARWLQQALREGMPTQTATPPAQPTPEAEDMAALAALSFRAGDTEDTPPQAEDDDHAIEADAVGLAAVFSVVPQEETPILVSDEALPEIHLPTLAAKEAVPADVAEDPEAPAAKTSLPSSAFAALMEKIAAPETYTGQEVATDKKPQPVDAIQGAAATARSAEGTEALTAQAVAQTPEIFSAENRQAAPQTPVASVALPHAVQSAAGAHHTASAAHAPVATSHDAVLEQVQVGIRQIAHEEGGGNRILIQLQPEELGRVDVRMDMGGDGRAHIVFEVDRPETFEQLQRDARSLEKALQEAGIKADAGSMEFNLRRGPQDAFAQMQGGTGERSPFAGEEIIAEEGHSDEAIAGVSAAAIPDAGVIQHTLTIQRGLDIRI